MSQEITMSFRLDPALRDDFAAAADTEHRPASQVLRELMRQYVADVSRATPAMAQGDAWTRNRRQARLRSLLGSVALEGYSVPDAFKDAAERFIDGDMSLDQLKAINDTLT